MNEKSQGCQEEEVQAIMEPKVRRKREGEEERIKTKENEIQVPPRPEGQGPQVQAPQWGVVILSFSSLFLSLFRDVCFFNTHTKSTTLALLFLFHFYFNMIVTLFCLIVKYREKESI